MIIMRMKSGTTIFPVGTILKLDYDGFEIPDTIFEKENWGICGKKHIRYERKDYPELYEKIKDFYPALVKESHFFST